MPTDTEHLTAQLFGRMCRTDDSHEEDRLRHEVVVLNLSLARRVATGYAGRGEPLDDLYQVACLALVMAVSRYDPDRCRVFHRYAIPCMHGEIKRHFRDHGWAIRPPRPVQEARPVVDAAAERLMHELHREPTTDEIARFIDVDADVVGQCLVSRGTYRLLSTDALFVGGEPAGRPDGAGRGTAASASHTGEATELVDERLALRSAVAELPAGDLRLFDQRFMNGWSQARIARAQGVSQAQVSRRLHRLLATMRRSLDSA